MHAVVERLAQSRPRLPGLARGDRQLLLAVGVDVLEHLAHTLGHRLGRHVVLAHGRLQGVEVGVVEHRRDLVEHLRLLDLLDRQTFAPQGPDQVLGTHPDGVLAPLTRVPLTNLVRGPMRRDEVEPVA